MTFPGGGMHIPDEWSRDNSKNGANAAPPKQPIPLKSTTGGAMTSGGQLVTNNATARKRKRVKTDVVVDADEPVGTKDSDMDTEITDIDLMLEQAPATTQQAKLPLSSSRQCDETESVIRGLYYQVEKLSRRPGCALDEGIHLDSIMTHIPYVDVLRQMFGGNAVKDSPCVPVVTRSYEESYMREVVTTTENGCVMGSNCECQFIDEHNPFIGVQFTLPVEALSDSNAGVGVVEELASNRLCVLCCRKNTQSLFYEALYNHRAYNACIQLYGNICDRPGEYATEAMLICPLSGPIHNMPLPVVAHQRNRYAVVIHNGIRQLRQHRVGYEDFHVPSSSRC
jgi:hypothetical protein